MKIAEVEVRHEHVPLSRPYAIASTAEGGGTDAVEISVVVLHADDGTLGLGTASAAEHVTGESAADTAAALGDLDWLRGLDPRRIGETTARVAEHLPAGAPAARAAVDTALWDLHARILGVPAWSLWGRPSSDALTHGLETSITLGIRTVEDTLEEAREALGRGFRALKVKIGLDADEDAERLERLRALAGPEIALRVDANEGYALRDLEDLGHRVERLGLEMVEQPVPRGVLERSHDLESSRRLRPRLAADESVITPRDAVALRAVCGILVLKLMKHGGPTVAREIAAFADAAGLELMWGCNDESVISIAAALHCAIASPATRYLDLDGSFDLARDPAEGGFRLVEGRLMPLDAPGLGVRLTEDG